jgi:Domain of unknown function (DUF4336)
MLIMADASKQTNETGVPAITKIDNGLWCLDSHFVVWGCKGSIRMTLIETPRGLVIYSPVDLSEVHLKQIAEIGQVAAIVAPNLFHHMFLRSCTQHFPQAQVFVPKGLQDKIGAISGALELSDNVRLAPPQDIDRHNFSDHSLHETILFHRATGTLVTADLIYNYQPEQHIGEKLFFRSVCCYGHPSVPFYHRFAVRDKMAVSRLIEAVMTWPVKRIIMSHGRIYSGADAGEIFAKVWSRFA